MVTVTNGVTDTEELVARDAEYRLAAEPMGQRQAISAAQRAAQQPLDAYGGTRKRARTWSCVFRHAQSTANHHDALRDRQRR